LITPRRTRLIRVPDLHAFRQAIVSCSTQSDPDRICSTAVVVPTRGAARHLARLYAVGAPIPALVTRDELYQSFNDRLAGPVGLLSGSDREVLLHSAASSVSAAGAAPPFALRPGLVAEMMRFYDQLRRQGQSVGRYEELLVQSLDVEGDRGAERLLRQTRFLAASYREYERRLSGLASVDEHVLRSRLIEQESLRPILRVVVAVSDSIADPDGLFPVDFDLLTRVPGLTEIDVVATARLLASGFDQRVHEWLPGLEDVDGTAIVASPSPVPEIVTPPSSGVGDAGGGAWVHRDREEELHAVVPGAGEDPSRTGVVFARPLPYLYLARQVFGSARMPYQTVDTLPLAAEPAAAALDLIIEFISSQFTRTSSIALLRSPQLVLGAGLSRQAIGGLDRALHEWQYLGEIEDLRAFVAELTHDADAKDAAVNEAAAVVARAAETLHPLTQPAPAAKHLMALASFLAANANPDAGSRSARAMAALASVLESLAAAHRSFASTGAGTVTIDELAPDIRRWIEEQTFDPQGSSDGLHLLDARAARFADFDSLYLVGLIEGEWSEAPRRNIFYSPAVLSALGWPSERDRRSASTAAFVDVLRSPSRRVSVSTFRFDDEALVEPSLLLEEIESAGLSSAGDVPETAARPSFDEALWSDPARIDVLDSDARDWAVFRAARSSGSLPAFHGAAGAQSPRPVSVSAIETYLTCPFKYFAQYVLRLDEEREDEEVMDPKRQGRFVHAVFEAFFSTWQNQGNGAITPANLSAARELFETVVEAQLAALPEAEAALERTRLIGSPVAAGLGEVVFRMEAERQIEVVERLLEYELKGDFEFAANGGSRRIALRGVADRLDLLADGTFRLIDYKLSSAPSKSRALQLPIYGLSAEQRLRNHRGRSWTLGEAAYISFRGARKITPLFTARTDRAAVLADAQERLVGAVDAIERGEFPPTPEDVFFCDFCSYGAVCRKDYVGDV
jgi:RecB family exonuclease